MSIRLYPHQDAMIAEGRHALRSHNAIIMQLATGGGKTPIAARIAKTVSEKQRTCFMVVHRKELLYQSSKTFTRDGIHHTIIASGKHYNARMRVCIATVGTLVRRLDEITPPSVLLVDEAHHSPAPELTKVIRWCLAAGGKVIGLTATPWRLDCGGFSHLYGDMVKGPSVSWLIANGFLSDYRLFVPFVPDLSGVHVRAGDYVQSEVEAIMGGKAVVGNCVSHYRRYANGMKAVVFAVSVKHSEQIVAEFIAAGISAAHIDGETPDAVRKHRILNFAMGHTQVLVNCMLLTEGFDLAAIAGVDAPIDCVILMRPTMSLSLYLQMVGRALRRKPYPAVILDMVGCVLKHGLPDSPYEWSLEPREKKRGKGKGDEPVERVKQCPKCFFAHTPGPPACPSCGHPYEANGRKLAEVAGDLQEVSKEEVSRMRKQEQIKATKLDDLIALAERRGYKNPEKWAGKVFTSRMQKKQSREPQFGW